ncbi:AAEL006086-PA [Aedes aegypti]|uniref:AAEL006086-PA n=1 Tax=Aedes aegypti TaxID=7159 RepID=Q177N8_AEDAE|nr:AAEL006086-PA [Aedes aegypti]
MPVDIAIKGSTRRQFPRSRRCADGGSESAERGGQMHSWQPWRSCIQGALLE